MFICFKYVGAFCGGALFVIAAGFAPLIGVCGQAISFNQKSPADLKTYVFKLPTLRTASPDELISTGDSLVLEREHLIFDLLDQLHSIDGSHSGKAETIYMLGSLRAMEAVPEMLRNIDYKDDRTFLKDDISPRGGFITRKALINIGWPAVLSIKNVIENKDSSYSFNASMADGFAEVLAGVEGRDLAITDLKTLMRQSKDMAVRSHFQIVLSRLQLEP